MSVEYFYPADWLGFRYADRTARAGVLEPEGIVEIKFRKDKMLAMMDRLDPTYRELKEKSAIDSQSADEASSSKDALAAREKTLWPTYSQIALQFADLHDTPVRMKAKGTIHEILDWETSRQYFYWRIQRRLKEEAMLAEIGAADDALDRTARLAVLDRATGGLASLSDRQAVDTLERAGSTLQTEIAKLKSARIAASIASMASLDRGAISEALQGVWESADVEVSSDATVSSVSR